MFSPTNEKTSYEQGENRTVILFSRQPRDRQFINFSNVPRHGLSLKEYQWVYWELYVWLRSVKDLILHENRKKTSLKTVDHHREGIYTSFKHKLLAFSEAVQRIEPFLLSTNVFGGSGFESPGFLVKLFFSFSFYSLFLPVWSIQLVT